MNNVLIMPKQAGKLDVFYASLEIFYESHLNNESWCENDFFKKRIVEKCPRIPRDTVLDGPYLVKQSELVRYFGLAIYEYGKVSGRAKITERGIEFYNAYHDNNLELQKKLIMESILHDSFGRNNTAIETSDSDVDAPKLFIKSCYDLNGISRVDFAYLLFLINDKNIKYDDALLELKNPDEDREIKIPSNLKNKYKDIKFIGFLRDLEIVIEEERIYYLSDFTIKNYLDDIKNLSIYNRIPDLMYTLISRYDNTEDMNDELEQKMISNSFPYKITDRNFIKENNRVPEPVSKKQEKYKVNYRISKTALEIAEYKCEINKDDHNTFLAKNGKQFMEAHHLIPMSAQKDFKINLDRVENIICLCPNCHSAIHFGCESIRKDYLEKLYNQRIDKLRAVGLEISLEDLFNKYYK